MRSAKEYFTYFKKCASCIYQEDLAEEGYRKCTNSSKQYIDKVTAYCSCYKHDPKYTETDINGNYID